jgi:hypothetical protein
VDPDLQQIGALFDEILEDWEWPSPPHDELEFDSNNIRGDIEQPGPNALNTPAWEIMPLFAENPLEASRAPGTPERSRERMAVRQDTEHGEAETAMVESQSRHTPAIRGEDWLRARRMNDELGGPRVVIQPGVIQGSAGGTSAETSLDRWIEQPDDEEPWWYGRRQGSSSFPGRAPGSEAKHPGPRLRRCASSRL